MDISASSFSSATTHVQPIQSQQVYRTLQPTLFCRVLYDYEVQEDFVLSCRADDILEILGELRSGWWDSLLGEKRGWFPSNYATIISDEEAKLAFSQAEFSASDDQTFTVQQPIPTVFHNLTMDTLTEAEERLDSESWHRNGNQVLQIAANQNDNQPSGFWMPQANPDGHIYFVNLQTGQRFPDVPQETEDEPSDDELAVLISPNDKQPNDSWMPQLTPHGRIYYLNLRTGQRSRGLPQGMEYEVSADELAVLASQNDNRPNDSWIPHVTLDSGVYYLNLRPGQRSRDLPQVTEDAVSDDAVSVLTSQSDNRPSGFWVPRVTSDGRIYYLNLRPTHLHRVSVSSKSESIHSYHSNQTMYSIASSRTTSTDYGLYCRRLAISQETIDEQSFESDGNQSSTTLV